MKVKYYVSALLLMTLSWSTTAFGLSDDELMALSADFKTIVIQPHLADQDLAKKICKKTALGLNENAGVKPMTLCSYKGNPETKYDFSIKFMDSPNDPKRIFVEIHNNLSDDRLESQFVNLHLPFNSEEELLKLVYLQGGHLIKYVEVREDLEEYLLSLAVEESEFFYVDDMGMIRNSEEPGVSYSLRGASNVIKRSSQKEEFNLKRQSIKALRDFAIGFGLGVVDYYRKESNRQDWDYEIEDFPDKFTGMSHWKFDDNAPSVNFGHALAGHAYYVVARSYGLSPLQSTAFTIMGSAIWELGEFRETISINDMILTSFGGAAMGEANFVTSDALRRSNKPIGKLLAWIVDPISSFYSWRGTIEPDRYNGHGESEQQTFIRISNEGDDGEFLTSLGMNSRVVKEALDIPGTGKKVLGQGVLSELLLEVGFDDEGIQRMEYAAKNILWGVHKKNIQENIGEGKRGYSFLIGPANGFRAELEKDRNPDPGQRYNKDWFAIAHVIGAATELKLFLGETEIDLSLEAYGDFSMMRPLAINGKLVDQSRVSSLMRNHGYTHATGYTHEEEMAVSRGPVEIGFNHRKHKFYGLNPAGLDRRPEDFEDTDSKIRDSRNFYRFWAEREFRERLTIRATVEVEHRKSTIQQTFDGQSITAKESDIEPTVMLTFSFDL